MSDISTDLQAAIDNVHAPLPEGREFRSSEISPECILKSTAQAMVFRFRQLREDLYSANNKLANAEANVDRLREMIREFCAGQDFADPAWRKQKHIQPLFDEAGYL